MYETARLKIRRFEATDWRDLYEYLSQEETVKFEPYDVFSEDACKQAAIDRSNNESFWAVCLKENDKLIGNIYLEKQEYETWELGYVFNAAFLKKGYATEAARFMVGQVIAKQNARRVIAMCNPLNEPSWRLMERIGMRREGHLLQNIYFKKDQNNQPIWSDTFAYAILASEWIESQ